MSGWRALDRAGRRPFAADSRRVDTVRGSPRTRLARAPRPGRRVRCRLFHGWCALGDDRAVPGPCPRAVSPSLDATAVPGRVLVVPDQIGFPTDMGCIGPIEVSAPGFFPGNVARRLTPPGCCHDARSAGSPDRLQIFFSTRPFHFPFALLCYRCWTSLKAGMSDCLARRIFGSGVRRLVSAFLRPQRKVMRISTGWKPNRDAQWAVPISCARAKK